MEHFGDRLAAAVAAVGSPLCVGIDPREPLPDACARGLAATRAGRARAYERYGVGIVEAVAGVAAAVKPQVAFFEALGGYGLAALEAVAIAAREHGLLVVADAKRGDIGSTAQAYAEAWLLPRGAGELPIGDALTVNPYLGWDARAAVHRRVRRVGRRRLRARADVEPGRGRPAGAAAAGRRAGVGGGRRRHRARRRGAGRQLGPVVGRRRRRRHPAGGRGAGARADAARARCCCPGWGRRAVRRTTRPPPSRPIRRAACSSRRAPSSRPGAASRATGGRPWRLLRGPTRRPRRAPSAGRPGRVRPCGGVGTSSA